jgi:glycosyltransferase involved in cell wall biosynthesis
VNAPASRTFEHARLWVKAGHQVVVITCVPNHPTGTVYAGYRNRVCQIEIIEGIKVVRVWTLLSPNEGFLRRSLNFISYLLSVTIAAPFLSRPDIVISTSPQFFCGLAGFAVSRIVGRPWVLEIRDLWPESILAVGAMKKRWLVRLLQTLARWSYRKADRVIALTEAFKEHIIAAGASASRVEVIKNGVDLFEFRTGAGDSSFTRPKELEGKFVAAYVGTHGMSQKLDTVLEAASRLRQHKGIAFLMVGSGAERARLLSLRDRMGLKNLVMMDQLPKPAVLRVLTWADVALVLLMKNELFKTVLPSKMFEAMAMQHPIVLGVEGEAKALLEQAGAGIAITPESADELATAIMRLADDPDLREKLGRQGYAHVCEHYNRRKLAMRYLEVLGAVITERTVNAGIGCV